MKWAARTLQATLFLLLFSTVSGKRCKKERGGVPIEGFFITQTFSWLLDLLIKEIISQ